MIHEFRADLHTHTNCSDGSDTPLELLEHAKAAGLSGLSITDHDTIQAYTPAVVDRARALNLSLLLGAEISSELEGQTIHILAYGFDASLQDFLRQVVQKREERNRQILAKFKKIGIDIDLEELRSAGPLQIIGRPHIAKVLVARKVVGSIQEAFDKYLKDDAPCYSIGGKFSPLEAIGAIHRAHGKAVLAHPHYLKRGRFLQNLLAHPFDGIECYYGRLAKELEKPWLQVAKERNWIATGGSDYHGAHRTYIQLGSSWVNEETFRKLCP